MQFVSFQCEGFLAFLLSVPWFIQLYQVVRTKSYF